MLNKIAKTFEFCLADDGENLAFKGEATASSDSHGGVASRAVDGDTDGIWNGGSCTHTRHENNPWFKVKLQKAAAVSKVSGQNFVKNIDR